MIDMGATASLNLGSSGSRQKRKASQAMGRTEPDENCTVAVFDPKTTTRQAGPKRLKRSYAFYEPLSPSASNRSNVNHGKLFLLFFVGIRHDGHMSDSESTRSQLNQRASVTVTNPTESLPYTSLAPARRTHQVRKLLTPLSLV